MKIGVLALQGAFREHKRAIEALGHQADLVRSKADLQALDGLIIPGGESTAMVKLIHQFDLVQALKTFIETRPVWGTCAGLILLANQVDGQEAYLGGMPIEARRNAYGRQLASFKTQALFAEDIEDYPMVFIRAPQIHDWGPGVEGLAYLEGQMVAGRYKQLMVTAFHPELTDDLRIHDYFIKNICGHKA